MIPPPSPRSPRPAPRRPLSLALGLGLLLLAFAARPGLAAQEPAPPVTPPSEQPALVEIVRVLPGADSNAPALQVTADTALAPDAAVEVEVEASDHAPNPEAPTTTGEVPPADRASASTSTSTSTPPSGERGSRAERDTRESPRRPSFSESQGSSGRDRRSDRRESRRGGDRESREPRSSRNRDDATAASETGTATSTNAPFNRLDYGSFRLISERNIFNTKRSARSSGPPPRDASRRAPRVDSFSLVGTMESSQGLRAFFDGSSSEYRKALSPGESIAGFRIAEITFSGAKLEGASNTISLHVSQQLRREEEGAWQVAEGSGTYSSSPSPGSSTSTETGSPSAPSTTPADGASESAVSDIVRKLMQQREKENQ